MRRPRIPDELCGRVDEWRGQVPFDRAVRELLERALNMSGEEIFRQRLEQPAEARQHERRPPPVAETWRR